MNLYNKENQSLKYFNLINQYILLQIILPKIKYFVTNSLKHSSPSIFDSKIYLSSLTLSFFIKIEAKKLTLNA